MGHLIRSAFACTITVVFLALSSPPAYSDTSTPEALVETFHTGLVSVMKGGETLGVKGRYDKILTYIDSYFHMPLMVMFVTGEHWQSSTSEARHAVLRAARRFGAGEMAVLFSEHSGEVFETDGSRQIKDNSVLVETSLVQSDGDRVKLLYRVRKIDDSWRIIDVLLDGSISQLLKRKGEYRRTLAENGLEGLTDLLNKKTDEMLESKAN